MYGKDKVTATYKVTGDFRFTEVNQYGDELSDGTIRFTKQVKVSGLSGLGRLLERVEKAMTGQVGEEEEQ